jgi:hypothetical protein
MPANLYFVSFYNKKELIMYINGHQFGGEYFEAAAIKKRDIADNKYTHGLLK